MKSTSVVSLATKSVETAQMLTSLLGKKRLLLTLAATLVCLQTVTAMKVDGPNRTDTGYPRDEETAQEPEKDPISWKLTQEEVETILREKGYETQEVEQLEPAGSQETPAEPVKKWTKGEKTYTFDEACEEANVFVKGPSKYANKHFWKLASTLGLGTVGVAIGFGFTADALAEIEKNHALEFDVDPVTDELVATGERGHKEILTKFGEGAGGNCIACLIGFLVAGGLALIMFAVVNYWVKGHNQGYMNLFQALMVGLTFGGGSCLMLGLNFMEQNAANSSDAFGNALTFSGDVGGTSGAEIAAGLALWVFFIAIIAVAALAFMFWKQKACFKAN